MNEIIKSLIKKKKLRKDDAKLVPSSYEVIGDILIFSDFPKELKSKEKIIAEEYIKQHKNINVVAKKIENFSGKYRLPKLKIIFGEKRKETIHVENGIRLKINPEESYFSSKMGHERLRIARQIKKNEIVLVMFSGIAPFNLTISKHSKAKEVHGVELNPKAHKTGLENILINKIKNIFLHKGNVKLILPKLNKKFNRILMPAPKNAKRYLSLAKKYLNKKGIIHLYTFEKEENFNELKKKYFKDFRKVKLIKCGQISPRVYRVCLDLNT